VSRTKRAWCRASCVPKARSKRRTRPKVLERDNPVGEIHGYERHEKLGDFLETKILISQVIEAILL
jgi:hypothetical protein